MKTRPLNVAHYEAVKLRVSDLRKGMFVCQLDRPWEETPFLADGFEVETEQDIEAVKNYCNHVYIDLGRTQAVTVKIEDTPVDSFADNNKQRGALENEILAAEVTKKETSNLIKSFLYDLRLGNSVDIQLAKNAVSQCVASVLRNPNALLLLMQMRRKNSYISEHSFNGCVYSILLGRLLGLDAKQLEELGTCGLLHDIGNIEIPDHILNKSGKLSEEEFAIIKQHPIYGRDILMSSRNIHPGAVDVAYGHHECPDGSGYPRGLKAEQINLNCRIVSVVDKYDAITRNAPYRIAQNHLNAVHILNILAETNKIDKQVCSTFVSYLGFYPPGTIVELSSGEIAIVLKTSPRQRLQPQVLVIRDREGQPVEYVFDLAENHLDERGNLYKIKTVHIPGYIDIDVAKYQNAIIQAYE